MRLRLSCRPDYHVDSSTQKRCAPPQRLKLASKRLGERRCRSAVAFLYHEDFATIPRSVGFVRLGPSSSRRIQSLSRHPRQSLHHPGAPVCHSLHHPGSSVRHSLHRPGATERHRRCLAQLRHPGVTARRCLVQRHPEVSARYCLEQLDHSPRCFA